MKRSLKPNNNSTIQTNMTASIILQQSASPVVLLQPSFNTSESSHSQPRNEAKKAMKTMKVSSLSLLLIMSMMMKEKGG